MSAPDLKDYLVVFTFTVPAEDMDDAAGAAADHLANLHGTSVEVEIAGGGESDLVTIEL